jgi:hypothetical protein
MRAQAFSVPPWRTGFSTTNHEGGAYVIAPDGAIVLKGEYAAEQEWLPFMAGVILAPVQRFELVTDPMHQPTPGDIRHHIKRGVQRTFVKQKKGGRRLNVVEDGVPQYVLPYREARAITQTDYERLGKMGYPGWDRTASGKHCEITFPANRRGNVSHWCKEFCQGQFYVWAHGAAFQNIVDATAAKLVHHAPVKID